MLSLFPQQTTVCVQETETRVQESEHSIQGLGRSRLGRGAFVLPLHGVGQMKPLDLPTFKGGKISTPGWDSRRSYFGKSWDHRQGGECCQLHKSLHWD